MGSSFGTCVSLYMHVCMCFEMCGKTLTIHNVCRQNFVSDSLYQYFFILEYVAHCVHHQTHTLVDTFFVFWFFITIIIIRCWHTYTHIHTQEAATTNSKSNFRSKRKNYLPLFPTVVVFHSHNNNNNASCMVHDLLW